MKPKFVWMDGSIIPWEQATIHVSTEAVLRAANVFEGMRAYPSHDNSDLRIFRNADHLKRLRQSAKIMRMSIRYTVDDLTAAFVDLIKANGFTDNVHFRPVVYFGEGESNQFDPNEIHTGVFVLAFSRPQANAVRQGVNSCISSWRRSPDLSSPSRVKAAGNYHNSRLAHVEARVNGFGPPIMLNDRGKVSEGPASCFMMVRDGVVITPPVTADILEGITRATLIELARAELGMTVVEREIDRSETYICDEAFFCGSGAEIVPILSIDNYSVGGGSVGPLTREIQRLYFDVVSGKITKYRSWLTSVYEYAAVAAKDKGSSSEGKDTERQPG